MNNVSGETDQVSDIMETPQKNAEFNRYLDYFIDMNRLKDKKRILVVEDDAMTRAYLKKLVKDYNHEITVFSASNVAEALEILRNQHCDLLIADYFLPQETNGLDLWNIASGEFPDLECMIVSSIDKELYTNRAKDSVNPPLFCQKPVTYSKLSKFLNFFLGGSHGNK